MKSNVENMLNNLSPAIEQKCEELQAARKERLQSRLFVLLCIMAVLVPLLLVFAGVSHTFLLVPFTFMALSMLLLLPVLLSGKNAKQGGAVYE